MQSIPFSPPEQTVSALKTAAPIQLSQKELGSQMEQLLALHKQQRKSEGDADTTWKDIKEGCSRILSTILSQPEMSSNHSSLAGLAR